MGEAIAGVFLFLIIGIVYFITEAHERHINHSRAKQRRIADQRARWHTMDRIDEATYRANLRNTLARSRYQFTDNSAQREAYRKARAEREMREAAIELMNEAATEQYIADRGDLFSN